MLGKLVHGIGSGIGVGIGLGVALGATAAARSQSVRPVLLGATRGAIALAEKTTALAATAREQAEDLYHEARAARLTDRDLRESAEASGGGTDGDGGGSVVIPRPSTWKGE